MRSSLGCGAVAVGQILYYWSCRVFPDDEISYTPSGFSAPISLNFYDQVYNWQGMGKNIADNSNALLLYHCAVALRSNFTSSATSSTTVDAYLAFITYFGFSADLQVESNYSDATWIDMLKTEINSGHPIFYRGDDTGKNGHAWVIDGYNSSNQFHCNWGWYGSSNSWYSLNALNTSGYVFNDKQMAILNISPLLDACSDLSGSSIICSSNTSYSVSVPSLASVSWTKSNNLTQVFGNTGTTYSVYATNNTGSTGFITATILNSQGHIFATRTKNVWIGKPNFTLIGETEVGVSMSGVASIDYPCDISQGVTNVNWYRSGTIASITGGLVVGKYRAGSQSGTGIVYANATNNCGSTEIRLFINVNANGYKIYPNPTSNFITIEIDYDKMLQIFKREPIEIRLYDKTRNLKKVDRFSGISKIINLSDLEPDVYILQIISQDKVFEEKIVKTYR